MLAVELVPSVGVTVGRWLDGLSGSYSQAWTGHHKAGQCKGDHVFVTMASYRGTVRRSRAGSDCEGVKVFRRDLASVVLATACLAACVPGASTAQTPPANSPVALGRHPRLFITADKVVEVRTRVAEHYRSEFQELLDLLGNPSRLTRDQRENEADWGSMNAAFVALLDPVQLRGLGFNLPGHLSTAQALCGQAYSYVSVELPNIAAAKALGHSSLSTGYTRALYLPAAATYDWCYPHLNETQRRAIVDAFVAGFNRKYANKNHLTMEIAGLTRLANNQASINIHDSLGILAFWGDSYPDQARQQAMYAAFHTIWMRRTMTELDVLYGTGTHWHEGPGGYFTESFTSLGLGIGALSSALGRSYPAEMPFFEKYGQFIQAIVKPNSLVDRCGSSGSSRCRPVFDRWGTISSGISGPSCAPMMLAAGLLRMHGNTQAAGLVKWGIDETSGVCGNTGRSYGGVWANSVLDWFLFGDRGIAKISPANAPLPLFTKHGLGLYAFRSGYDAEASQVLFFAQPLNTYGHGSPDYGTFSLHKYGNLIVQAGNGKSGEGAISRPQGFASAGTLLRNMLTLHKGSSDAGLTTNGSGEVEATFAEIDQTTFRTAGTVLAESLSGSDFGYVSYDLTPKFAPTTANVAQRELVYLRGPGEHEFVVVLDRFNALRPDTDEKIWRIWVPTQPQFVNGQVETPRTGKWTSQSADTISVTNRFDSLRGEDFIGGPTRGKFFMKTLWPSRPVINFLGGPGKEFQSGNDDGTTPWGAPELSQAAREYLGWGRIEVRPNTNASYDLFLNVIQFGHADRLSAMSRVARLDLASHGMAGAHIADAANEWVVLFARDNWPQAPRSSATYTIQAASATNNHLLLNMAPSTTFRVSTQRAGDGTQISVSSAPGSGVAVTSSDVGVLRFRLSGQVVSAPIHPAAPRLREGRAVQEN